MSVTGVSHRSIRRQAGRGAFQKERASKETRHVQWQEAPLSGLEPLKSEGSVGVQISFQVQMEALGGCEHGRGVFAFCKITPAVVRRVDLREQEGKKGNTVRQGLG